MDKNRISGIINQIIADSGLGNVEIFFEENDVIRLEVISNNFKGMRLLKRIDMLSKLFLDVAMNELADFHLVFNPLTANEKLNGISELLEEAETKPKKAGIAASSFY